MKRTFSESCGGGDDDAVCTICLDRLRRSAEDDKIAFEDFYMARGLYHPGAEDAVNYAAIKQLQCCGNRLHMVCYNQHCASAGNRCPLCKVEYSDADVEFGRICGEITALDAQIETADTSKETHMSEYGSSLKTLRAFRKYAVPDNIIERATIDSFAELDKFQKYLHEYQDCVDRRRKLKKSAHAFCAADPKRHIWTDIDILDDYKMYSVCEIYHHCVVVCKWCDAVRNCRAARALDPVLPFYEYHTIDGPYEGAVL